MANRLRIPIVKCKVNLNLLLILSPVQGTSNSIAECKIKLGDYFDLIKQKGDVDIRIERRECQNLEGETVTIIQGLSALQALLSKKEIPYDIYVYPKVCKGKVAEHPQYGRVLELKVCVSL